MKNIRIKSTLFTMLLFSLPVLFSQTTTQVKEAQAIKKKVESGQMSPAEAMQKAQEAGATPSQVQMAKEKMQTQEAATEQKVESESQTEKEQLIDQQDILTDEILQDDTEELEEIIEEDISKQVAVKSASIDFGYNFFKGSPSSFQPVKIGPVDPNYQIGPGDEIVIHLWGDTELRYTLMVSREGTIYIDNVGQVIVNGLTLEKLEKKLLKYLSKVYESLNPDSGRSGTYLDVTLGKLKPITVFFLGEVGQLGAYQVDSYSTAFTALYYVGGPTHKGSLRDIQVIRSGEVVAHFDLYDYLLSGKKVNDIRLQNEDHIFIPPRGKTITLRGEVLHPAIFELNENETLRDLVEFAGGLLTGADLNRVQIERLIPFEERTNDVNIRTVLDYEFTKIKKGKISVKKIELSDLDLITVYPLLDPQMDYVTIAGAVFRPGKYALEENMSINQLIEKTQGYLPDVYLEKADLTREHLDGHTEHFDINLTSLQADTLQLQDWDHLHIYSIWDVKKKKTVSITGHVWRPGQYTLHDSMMVSDLLFKAGGMDEPYYWQQTYQERADLIRYNEDQITTFIIPIKLDSLIQGDSANDMILQHRDELKVYAIDVIHIPETVKIMGEVKKPREFELYSNMKLHDIILRAGGFTKSAYIYKVEVYRVDPYNITADTLSVVHRLEVNPELLTSFTTSDDFTLQDKDIVVVRKHPDFQYQRIVTLGGEVTFPGAYSLLKKGETLRAIIKRAGGLTNEAFIDGIQFIRKGQSLASNYNKVIKGLKKYDIELIEGDSIFIPIKPGVVFIEGMVNNPSIIKYQKGWSVNNYIDAAGGFHRDADKNEVFVYYVNGQAKEIGWLFSPKILDGSRIVIGREEEKENIDWTELSSEISSIFASLVTIIFVLSANR